MIEKRTFNDVSAVDCSINPDEKKLYCSIDHSVIDIEGKSMETVTQLPPLYGAYMFDLMYSIANMENFTITNTEWKFNTNDHIRCELLDVDNDARVKLNCRKVLR